MKILFATTNKAKVKRYANQLKERNIDIITLNDLNIELDVEEDGLNPIENAIIKASAYAKVSKLPTIALDEGLFLDNVPNDLQPGVNVRRVNGKRLNDQEMIIHYTSLVDEYGEDGQLNGYFLKGIAIVNGEKTITHQSKAPRCFLNKSSKVIDEGYPLASIQLVPEFNKFKSELTKEEEELITNFEQIEILDFIINTVQNLEPKEQVK